MRLWVADGPSQTDVPASTRWRDLAIVAVFGLALYAPNVDFWLYGDSAMYADFSLRRSFVQVTLHLGYYFLVIAAQATVGTLLHWPIEQTMSWLNVVSGAALLCVSYLLALELQKSRQTALFTVLILGVSGRMLTNSTTSEIYVTQTLFVMISFLLFARDQFLWAGAAATASLLISPLSAFAFLFFPVFDYQRAGRIRWNVLLKLGAASLLLYAPYLVWRGHELLWGVRGLLVIQDITPTDPATAARNFPKYQFKQFTTMLVLFLPMLLAWRKHKAMLVLAAAVAIPHVYVIIKLTGEDNVFIFNTDFFFALLLALGWTELLRRGFTAWIGPAAVAAHVALLLVAGSLFTFNSHRDYPDEMRGVFNTYVRDKDAKVITDWGTAMAFSFYARDSAATSLAEEPVMQRVYDLDNQADSNVVVLEGKELYLLDRWNPTPLNKFFRSEQVLAELMQANSLRFIAERRLGVSCVLLQQRTNRLYRCTLNAAAAS